MGALLGQAPESTLQNQGRQVRGDIAATDELAEGFARSASSPLQAAELPALLHGSPRLVPRIRDRSWPSSVVVGCGRWA